MSNHLLHPPHYLPSPAQYAGGPLFGDVRVSIVGDVALNQPIREVSSEFVGVDLLATSEINTDYTPSAERMQRVVKIGKKPSGGEPGGFL
jgi:hypothetical protein